MVRRGAGELAPDVAHATGHGAASEPVTVPVGLLGTDVHRRRVVWTGMGSCRPVTSTVVGSECRGPWAVADTVADVRTSTNPLVVDGPRVRSYASAWLVAHDDTTVGALSVLAEQPRDFTGDELQTLEDLAGVVMHQLELLLATRRALLAT